jgi:predicted methyltransferase
MEKSSKKLPPLLTSETANLILNQRKNVSIDLGKTNTTFSYYPNEVLFPSNDKIPIKILRKIAKKPNNVFFVKNEKAFLVALRVQNHFYKLFPTDGAPTIEIDGIRMHRTKNTTPDKDSEEKIRILGADHGIILDTCMGLGYTAIKAAQNGANKVISVEVDASVLRIAELNPWSQKLFSDHKIHKVISDTYHFLDSVNESLFNFIVHDPPRHKSAGSLYGKAFYFKLYKTLKPKGRLFHYTGEPRSRYRGVKIHRGVSNRLREIGFKNVEYHKQVLGFTCEK